MKKLLLYINNLFYIAFFTNYPVIRRQQDFLRRDSRWISHKTRAKGHQSSKYYRMLLTRRRETSHHSIPTWRLQKLRINMLLEISYPVNKCPHIYKISSLIRQTMNHCRCLGAGMGNAPQKSHKNMPMKHSFNNINKIQNSIKLLS